MRFEDLTKEQLIEIAKLAYPFDDWVHSGYDVFYQPYDESHYSDAVEYHLVSFDGIVMADKVGRIRLFIYPTLDCDLDYYYKDDEGKMIVSTMDRLPVRNQREIQFRFTEFGF